MFINHPCERIVIENPIPHKHAELPKYSQIIQPYQFGETETKATCLWLKGVPELKATEIISKDKINRTIHNVSPGPNRSKVRSKTFKGIAEAMANQWNTNLVT